MKKYSTKGKRHLIQELTESGFSVRKARRAVNAVFDCMARAARRGEVVEIPGGSIRARIREGKPRRTVAKLMNVNTGGPMYQIVHYPGRRRVVQFRPDETLDLTPLPKPPTPEELEGRELASQLLGHRVDEQIMARLQEAAEFPRLKEGVLLRRLKECWCRAWRPGTVEELFQMIRSLYWI